MVFLCVQLFNYSFFFTVLSTSVAPIKRCIRSVQYILPYMEKENFIIMQRSMGSVVFLQHWGTVGYEYRLIAWKHNQIVPGGQVSNLWDGNPSSVIIAWPTSSCFMLQCATSTFVTFQARSDSFFPLWHLLDTGLQPSLMSNWDFFAVCKPIVSCEIHDFFLLHYFMCQL